MGPTLAITIFLALVDWLPHPMTFFRGGDSLKACSVLEPYHADQIGEHFFWKWPPQYKRCHNQNQPACTPILTYLECMKGLSLCFQQLLCPKTNRQQTQNTEKGVTNHQQTFFRYTKCN